MTARIEIGRLAAKDLGKTVDALGLEGVLVGIEHFIEDDGDEWTAIRVELIKHQRYRRNYFRPSTLIDVTGTNNKEQA